MRQIIFLTFLIFLVLACSGPLGRVRVGLDRTDRTCTKSNKASLPVGPFENSHSKVQLTDSTKEVLSAGTALSVIMRERCMNADSAKWPFAEGLSPEPQADREIVVRHVLTKDMTVPELRDLANANSCIKGVTESLPMQLFGSIAALPSDPQVSQQFQLTSINAGPAFDIFFNEETGIREDVTVAVIDSGLQMDHEDLMAHLWVNPKEVAGNGLDDDGNGYVDDVHGYNFAHQIGDPSHQYGTNLNAGHGTPVAGIAGAVGGNSKGVAGVAFRHVRLMPLVVFSRDGAMESVHVEQAIRYAADQGAHVVNLSLGAYRKIPTMEDAIAYAINKGTFVVAAAGNAGNELSEEDWVSPGSYGRQFQGAFAVASTKARTGGKCSESNYSTSFVEIAAPGCDGIYTTQAGSNSYGGFGGTSSASPAVTGGVALAYAFIKSRTGIFPSPAEVETILKRSSRVEGPLSGLVENGRHLDLNVLAMDLDQDYPGGDEAGCP